MFRVLVVAAIFLGTPICCQGKLAANDPHIYPDAAYPAEGNSFQEHAHVRVAEEPPRARVAEEPPRVLAYSPEAASEDMAPRTKFVYDDYDTYQRNELSRSRYGKDERPSHQDADKSEYSPATMAAVFDAPELQAERAYNPYKQYKPQIRQDSRSEPLPDHKEPSQGRYANEHGDWNEYPIPTKISYVSAAAAEEPETLVIPDHAIQDYPKPQERHEARSEQSPDDAASEDALDSAPESPSQPPVQHHLQDAKRRIMLKAIGIELAETLLVPEVLPPKFEPEFGLSLRFNNEPVEMGQLLTVNNTRFEPTIEFDAQPGQIFTLGIVDPDAPSNSRHGYRSYRHLLISNLEKAENSTSTVLTSYQPPQPEFGTGAHRYAVVVLRQRSRYNLTEADVPESRVRFDIVEWGNKRKMKPVAASYFMVKRNHVNE
ncbi:hypothetical protein GGI20_002011 [Coemansia sp. BCRC 34301]|nr:hypothetical protein GGI20_002011 [Coemansia sp. BCRC 34301]